MYLQRALGSFDHMADQNRGRDGANAAGDRRDGVDDRLDLGEDGDAVQIYDPYAGNSYYVGSDGVVAN